VDIKVVRDILGANDQLALKNRRLLDDKKVFAINIMSSPGSGKTSLILKTAEKLKEKFKIGVIEGDIASSVDAEKMSQAGLRVVQINTGGECHLDANMVSLALDNLELDDIEVLFVENVGNLVCPAEFKLGEHLRVMILSAPEGEDKPFKYPLMFTESEAVVINKIDLLPYVKFDLERFEQAVKGINPAVRFFPLSCYTGEGLEEWVLWLSSKIERARG
jgi:hydrogenase nickel incorporation protein HypB